MTWTSFRAVRLCWGEWEMEAARYYRPCKRCHGADFDDPDCPGYICDDCAEMRFDLGWLYYSPATRAYFTARLMAARWSFMLRWRCRQWLKRMQAGEADR